jgi:bifunctional DNA-binding transcriptional regulator/antitoxin component of YhaV-PrlF toxin-antitoxin module
VASVDDRGRITADVILRALGWAPGTRIRISQQSGLLVVTADPGGAEKVTPQGHLRLLVPLRRWCGLEPGSRVLLVADADEQRLVVHPPAALDAMISDWYDARLTGDAA